MINIEKHISNLVDNCNALISFHDHCECDGYEQQLDPSQILSWIIYQLHDILLAYRMLNDTEPESNNDDTDSPLQ